MHRFDGFVLPTAWDVSCLLLWAWLQQLTVNTHTVTAFVTGIEVELSSREITEDTPPLMYKSFCNGSNVVFLMVMFLGMCAYSQNIYV